MFFSYLFTYAFFPACVVFPPSTTIKKDVVVAIQTIDRVETPYQVIRDGLYISLLIQSAPGTPFDPART